MNTIQSAAAEQKQASKVFSIAMDGLFIALTCIITFFVQIRLPFAGNGGLIHLGNVPLFIAAILFGKRTGALAGGIGMGLFDLLSGWAIWAPFTFIIVGLMGFSVGAVTEKHKTFFWNVFAIILACIIKIVGYYIAEVIIYGNWLAPAGSIPGNILQVVVAGIIVLPIIPVLRKGLK
ncbi:MAG: putative rane protein [Anaerocolumna sp.]|jgi:uncharacterized membrane protein|nr:putative rane protein [Anaerocolumna sp.]